MGQCLGGSISATCKILELKRSVGGGQFYLEAEGAITDNSPHPSQILPGSQEL